MISIGLRIFWEFGLSIFGLSGRCLYIWFGADWVASTTQFSSQTQTRGANRSIWWPRVELPISKSGPWVPASIVISEQTPERPYTCLPSLSSSSPWSRQTVLHLVLHNGDPAPYIALFMIGRLDDFWPNPHWTWGNTTHKCKFCCKWDKFTLEASITKELPANKRPASNVDWALPLGASFAASRPTSALIFRQRAWKLSGPCEWRVYKNAYT